MAKKPRHETAWDVRRVLTDVQLKSLLVDANDEGWLVHTVIEHGEFGAPSHYWTVLLWRNL